MSKNVKILIGCGIASALLGCVLCVVLFGGTIWGVFKLTEPVADVGSDFMRALRDEDYDYAFELCSPAYQERLGSAGELGSRVRELDLTPKSWSWSNRSINNQDGALGGPVTFADGRKEQVSLSLVKIGGKWRITECDMLE